jgi:hypothetical protein
MSSKDLEEGPLSDTAFEEEHEGKHHDSHGRREGCFLA